MMHVLRAELARLVRPGSVYAAASVLAVAALTTSVIFGQSRPDAAPGTPGVVSTLVLEASNGLVTAFAFSSLIVGGAFLVLFARNVTNDYQHATLKTYLAREPRRLVFLAGKFTATTLFATAALLLAAIVSVLIAVAIARARGIDTGAWWTLAGWSETFLGLARLWAGSMVWGLFGFALGTTLRAAGPAIGVGIGTFALGGHLVERFFDDAASWFPSLVLSAFTAGGTNEVSLGLAGTMAALYAVVLATIASVSFTRGDVPG